MSKKHCKMICVYCIKDNFYEIRNVLMITRQGNIISLIDDYNNDKSYHCVDRRGMVRICINLARENGDYEVDHWFDFGVTWYDVNLIDNHTSAIERIFYDD